MSIKIMIVEDHALMRHGLRTLLMAQPDMEVVAEAGDVATALEELRQTKLDVITLDVGLPDGSGKEVLEFARRECPSTKFLVVTAKDDPSLFREMLSAGAAGYVVKSVEMKELLSAIRAVHAGRTFVLMSMNEDFAGTVLEYSGNRIDKPEASMSGLSRREEEVLAMVARGYTSDQIARQLFLSTKTIETYRSRAAKKLGLRGRSEMVQYAMDTGLLNSGSAAEARP